MQICTDEGCAPTEDVDMAGPLGFASVEGQDGDSWTFSVGMTRLERFTVRTLTRDGTLHFRGGDHGGVGACRQ